IGRLTGRGKPSRIVPAGRLPRQERSPPMGKASSIRQSLIHALLAATTAGFLASSAQAFFFPRPITVPPRNVQDPGNSVTPYTPPPPPPPPPPPSPTPPPSSPPSASPGVHNPSVPPT